MECKCHLRDVHDNMANEKTAFGKKCGHKFDGPSILCGIFVGYIPITTKDKSRAHQFRKKTLKGIFFGYVPRRGGCWSADLMIADLQE